MFKTKFITTKNLLDWNIKFKLGLTSSDVKKDQLLLEAGQRCDYFYYVVKGCLRLYYFDLDGNQVTHWFSVEDSIVTSPFSFFYKEENILYVEALEDTEVLLITSEQFSTINDKVDYADKEIRKLFAEFAMTFSRRIMDIHTKTADERYLKLMTEHPYLFQKAKLSHIASFLGITQSSLSRIRKSI